MPPSQDDNHDEPDTVQQVTLLEPIDTRTGRQAHRGAVPWKKYAKYPLEVDPLQDDKAKEIMLCSLQRPHMRAFHCNWWAFFAAFFMWYSISPLLPDIRDDLGLTNADMWSSNIAGVGGTMLIRIVLGPLCDLYGPRILFSVILCVAAIPTACTGVIHSLSDLIILRAFIGIAGGSFVMCEFWSSRMFCKEIVGTANGLVAGWGNLGAGVTQLVMGSILYPLLTHFLNDDRETAWRTVCIFPAAVAFVTGILIYGICDDAPKGNYRELKENGVFPRQDTMSIASSFYGGCSNRNTWLLAAQYACCFGVKLTMNNAAALYFRDEFGQSTEAAAAITAIFGWLNLFARGLGGFLSDYGNWKWGMRGRLWFQTLCLFMEGVFVFIFSRTSTLGGSIITLVFFSLFVQACDGTTFGIVPYVEPKYMGTVMGIVGAGGNAGAVGFGFAFRNLGYRAGFNVMGICILGSCLLSALVQIPGYSSMFWGKDLHVDKETNEILSNREYTSSSNNSKRRGERATVAVNTVDEDEESKASSIL